ncbi:MAG: DUF3667 domain-containing protein [Pseudomonadota bacterium]
MVDGDILEGDSDPSSGEGADTASDDAGSEEASDKAGALTTAPDMICRACAAPIIGAFCAACGQKNDDMRRSSVILGRDFLRDTFGFDSRMWRTLGLLVVAPGVVPKNYAHGQRSRFTPPVRLFIVVSFLFFLTVGFTNTLFIGLDVKFGGAAADDAASGVIRFSGDGEPAAKDEKAPDAPDCVFQAQTRFFVRPSELNTDRERLAACMAEKKNELSAEIQSSIEAQASEASGDDAIDSNAPSTEELEKAEDTVTRVFDGIDWAISNPRAFNDAFNSWLPRVMFLMTPVLALILIVFIRGRDAFIYDHLVLSLYTHAVAFAITGFALVLGQAGLPFSGAAAAGIILIYYFIALKRAYGRGWIKTTWTAFWSGFVYILILLAVVMSIVSYVVWRAVV